jgi:aryl-alcohol dehydrogenase-like predicted oxidoreductase
MQTTLLGRTGLSVTAAGLGCGGFSRIGVAKYGEAHASGIARAAYDAGVTFFDTAAVYGTETALGKGLAGLPRSSYVLSTKFPYRGPAGLQGPELLVKTLDESLRALGTDYIDVYHIHAVTAADYPWVRGTLLPELLRAKEKGKIRFVGITEQFAVDTSHEMLKLALPENHFDVIMTGYNLLNPSAAKTVLPTAIKNNVAVLCMFAVRSALSNPAQLKIDLGRILARSQGGAGLTDDPHILDFLLEPGAAESITEAAYRFARHTPGITVTLTGTSEKAHLLANLRSINAPPLPSAVLARLSALFGNVDCVSGQ